MLRLKINKVENTPEYGCIFDVGFPIRFFFNKDGTFDGIEIFADDAKDRDHKLISELLEKLSETTGIKHGYIIEEDVDEPNPIIYEDYCVRVRDAPRKSDGQTRKVVQYHGEELTLVGFTEIENEQTKETEFLLKQKNKQILVYPLKSKTILKSFLWFLIENLGYQIIDMRDIIDHHNNLEKKFSKKDKMKERPKKNKAKI